MNVQPFKNGYDLEGHYNCMEKAIDLIAAYSCTTLFFTFKKFYIEKYFRQHRINFAAFLYCLFRFSCTHEFILISD